MMRVWVLAMALGLCACATDAPAPTAANPPPAKAVAEATPPAAPPKPLPPGLDPTLDRDPFPSTYTALPSHPVAIVGATVLTATGQQIENGVVVMADGKIASVGPAGAVVPAGA